MVRISYPSVSVSFLVRSNSINEFCMHHGFVNLLTVRGEIWQSKFTLGPTASVANLALRVTILMVRLTNRY